MPALKLTDDLGRTLVFPHAPTRVVSLVPSDTYSVIALGAGDRLVGRTTWCEHGDAPTVGGTKDVDVEAVLALAPHLVIANQEENTRQALEALAARVPVLVSLPRRVEQGVAHLARLARILGVEASPVARELIRRGYQIAKAGEPSVRAFVPIWMDPLMTLNADTFGSDVLAHAGVANVFGDRLRLYPLAADLGKSAPQDAGGRDVRYPRVTLDEVMARGAELLVLPDEPYAFTPDDAAVLRKALPSARVVHVSGKDLFWYGAWAIDAIERLRAQLLQPSA
ncbi:MAG: ABC transporter substrate-binding protein [Deltaproteobacteria bacterium]|nr:ABC transporter substrate-binding protein [Deltaproteobacteria bacterium]